MTTLQRIMQIDDDSTILNVTDLSLSSVGKIQFLGCESAHDAITQFNTFAPQLVLIDVNMPEMDGREVLSALKEKDLSQTVAYIFMTASVDKSEHESLRALGAFEVIEKPFDPTQLPAKIRDIWQSWKKEKNL